MKMKQKIFRKFAALMMAVVAMNCSGMTVFAAEDIESMQPVETIVDEANSAIDTQQSTTNLVSNATYYWNQSTSSAIIFPEFHCDSAPNINIYFECIARSNDAGTFHVKLQKKGAFGIWSTVGNIYTTSQHGTQSYNLRTGQYVQEHGTALVGIQIKAGTIVSSLRMQPTSRELNCLAFTSGKDNSIRRIKA